MVAVRTKCSGNMEQGKLSQTGRVGQGQLLKAKESEKGKGQDKWRSSLWYSTEVWNKQLHMAWCRVEGDESVRRELVHGRVTEQRSWNSVLKAREPPRYFTWQLSSACVFWMTVWQIDWSGLGMKLVTSEKRWLKGEGEMGKEGSQNKDLQVSETNGMEREASGNSQFLTWVT